MSNQTQGGSTMVDHYDLAPCPFCGGNAYFHGLPGDPDCSGCHHIECSACHVMVDLGEAADPRNECVALTQLRRKIAPMWSTRVNI